MNNQNRIILAPEDIPRRWYNLVPDLPKSPPPYKNLVGEEISCLEDIFTKTSSSIEFSKQRWINIPEEVLDAYIRCGRPMPLIRAHRLEDYLKTCAKIYYKCENLNPVGTFKTNTALPQAYWAMKEGFGRTVFTGSSSTRTKMSHAYAAKYYGLTPTVYFSKRDSDNNLEHVKFLEMMGADIHFVSSNRTKTEKKILQNNSINPNIIDIVRSEVEKEAKNDETVAVISSFLNHVLLTQTIMGLETEIQLHSIEEKPDIIIAPVGGGSNFYGYIAPFFRKKLRKESEIKFLAAESETSAKLTNGCFDYVRLQSPASNILAKTYEYKMEIPRPEIMGVGIQTSNTAPLLGYLRNQGYVDTIVYPKDERKIYEVAKIFLQTEGHLIAPESAYAVKAAIDEAIRAKKELEERVILVSVSATSYMDFGEKQRYLKYMNNTNSQNWEYD